MRPIARVRSRDSDLRWPAHIGLSGLILAIADRVALNPQLVFLLGGGAALGAMVFIPTEAFFGIILLSRNLADRLTISAGGANIGAVIGALAIGAGFLRIVGRPRQPRGLGFGLLLMLLLTVWTIVGYINFGIDGSITREFLRVTSIIILGLLASSAVRRFADLERIAGLVVLVTIVPAVVGLVDWVRSGSLSVRLAGTFAHSNSAAAAFGVALALSLWKLLELRTRKYAWAAAILAVALLGTRSLGGLAEMMVMMLVYSMLARRGGNRRPMIASIVAIVLIAVFSLSPIGQGRVDEVKTTQSFSAAAQGEQTNSLDWRFGNWAKLLHVWKSHPFFGFGSGATTSLVQPDHNIPHSDVLRLLVETGVFGFAVFVAVYLMFMVALYRKAREPGETARFAGVLFAIIVGLNTHALVNNITLETSTTYMLSVLVGGLWGLPSQTRAAGESEPAGESAPEAVRATR